MIECACGCGQLLVPLDKKGRPRRFIANHQTKILVWKRSRPYGPSPTLGTKASDETRLKLSLSHIGQSPANKGKPGPQAWNKGMTGVFSHTEETKQRIGEALRGNRSHLWRGGHTPRDPRIHTPQWRALRKKIYKRDGWKCCVCGKAAGKGLQCHHIIPVRHGGTDAPDFLVSVCKSCHRKQESKYGQSDYFWAEKVKEWQSQNIAVQE